MKTSTILKIAKKTSSAISKFLIACAEAKEKKCNKALDDGDSYVASAKALLQRAREAQVAKIEEAHKLSIEAHSLRAAAKSLEA